MAEYRVSSPDVEMLGGMILSLWSAFPDGFESLAAQIMEKHGISNVAPENWHRFQHVLDALREIEQQYGTDILYQTGIRAAEKAPVPSEVDTLKKCLHGLNVTSSRFHRGGEIGGYEVRETEERGVKKYFITVSTPYPCSLTRGYLEGFTKRFGHEAKEVIIRHDELTPCRRQGAETCTYVISLW
jgi:hypothetical protein